MTAAGLAAAAAIGSPPIGVLYALAALLAAFVSFESVVVFAIVPNLVDRRQLRAALALEYGLGTLTMVVGPALGGLVISVLGLTWAYALDAISCAAMVLAVLPIAAQQPHGLAPHERLRASIVEGLRYVRSNQTGTGALYSAIPVGATVAAMTTGWLPQARRLGLVVIWAVVVWGTTIAFAGLAHTLWLAALLFAMAGAADSVSAVCRTTINQTVTPERMRGRMSAVYSLVVSGGPRIGDIESGAVAGATSARFSVVSGGVLCVIGVAAIVVAFPALVRYDAEDWVTAPVPSST